MSIFDKTPLDLLPVPTNKTKAYQKSSLPRGDATEVTQVHRIEGIGQPHPSIPQMDHDASRKVRAICFEARLTIPLCCIFF